MTDDTLLRFRKQIDEIDTSILELLEKRMRITDQVGDYKRANSISILQKGREEALLENLKNLATHPILTEKIHTIFQPIIETSKLSMQIKNLKPSPFNRVGILGLGVIGGSIAKILKAKDFAITISTLKRDSEDLTTAGRLGFVDHAYESLDDFVKNNDLIIIASPINTVENIADSIAKINTSHKKITVIDVASVKGSIAKKFERISSDSIEFLPTHPMAGSKKIGFAGSSLNFFMQRPWIIVPHSKSKPETIELIKTFIESLGSNTIVLDATTHDAYAAIVSHLIFLISTYLFAYAKTNPKSLQIAGSGFETTTRLASGNPSMHAQIVEHNSLNISRELGKLIDFIKSHPVTKDTAEEFFVEHKKTRDEYIEK